MRKWYLRLAYQLPLLQAGAERQAAAAVGWQGYLALVPLALLLVRTVIGSTSLEYIAWFTLTLVVWWWRARRVTDWHEQVRDRAAAVRRIRHWRLGITIIVAVVLTVVSDCQQVRAYGWANFWQHGIGGVVTNAVITLALAWWLAWLWGGSVLRRLDAVAR